MTLPWHLYLMGAIFIETGINHLRVPKIYLRMIPPSLPYPKAINIISGVAEFILGITLCFPQFSHWAAWGLIALLVAVFPANVFMFTNKHAGMGLPKWLLLVRLPLQVVLIAWAYLYT